MTPVDQVIAALSSAHAHAERARDVLLDAADRVADAGAAHKLRTAAAETRPRGTHHEAHRDALPQPATRAAPHFPDPRLSRMKIERRCHLQHDDIHISQSVYPLPFLIRRS